MTSRTRHDPDPNPQDHYDFSKQIGHLLRRAYQRHTALFQQIIPNDQLTAAQLVSLCAIKDSGACSLSHIVKQTAIDQATIRGVISRLKSRGLVTTQHDGLDKRRVLVQLTPKGAGLVDAMVPYAFDVTEKTFSGLNSAERVALLYLLTKMCQADNAGLD
jgi:DNA-binding MarR family transcriptional regulator